MAQPRVLVGSVTPKVCENPDGKSYAIPARTPAFCHSDSEQTWCTIQNKAGCQSQAWHPFHVAQGRETDQAFLQAESKFMSVADSFPASHGTTAGDLDCC